MNTTTLKHYPTEWSVSLPVTIPNVVVLSDPEFSVLHTMVGVPGLLVLVHFSNLTKDDLKKLPESKNLVCFTGDSKCISVDMRRIVLDAFNKETNDGPPKL